MTKIQNSKSVLVIRYWNLRFICNLVLGAWDFIDSITSPPQKAAARGERACKPPQGAAQSRLLPRIAGSSMGPDSLLLQVCFETVPLISW